MYQILSRFFSKELSIAESIFAIFVYETYNGYTLEMWAFAISLGLLLGYIKYHVRD